MRLPRSWTPVHSGEWNELITQLQFHRNTGIKELATDDYVTQWTSLFLHARPNCKFSKIASEFEVHLSAIQENSLVAHPEISCVI